MYHRLNIVTCSAAHIEVCPKCAPVVCGVLWQRDVDYREWYYLCAYTGAPHHLFLSLIQLL